MIARVTNYSATVSAPDIAERNLGGEYEPLLQKLCVCGRDFDDFAQQVRLAMKCGIQPLIVVFEPKRSVKHGN